MTDIELKLKELIELDINDLEELELIEELNNDIID
tara:strand:- start:1320 stop:1424 length:105 start_codon:yes stop_codon:yes gene_type:complete